MSLQHAAYMNLFPSTLLSHLTSHLMAHAQDLTAAAKLKRRDCVPHHRRRIQRNEPQPPKQNLYLVPVATESSALSILPQSGSRAAFPACRRRVLWQEPQLRSDALSCTVCPIMPSMTCAVLMLPPTSAGVVFDGMTRVRARTYRLRAVLCQMVGSFGDQVSSSILRL